MRKPVTPGADERQKGEDGGAGMGGLGDDQLAHHVVVARPNRVDRAGRWLDKQSACEESRGTAYRRPDRSVHPAAQALLPVAASETSSSSSSSAAAAAAAAAATAPDIHRTAAGRRRATGLSEGAERLYAEALLVLGRAAPVASGSRLASAASGALAGVSVSSSAADVSAARPATTNTTPTSAATVAESFSAAADSPARPDAISNSGGSEDGGGGCGGGEAAAANEASRRAHANANAHARPLQRASNQARPQVQMRANSLPYRCGIGISFDIAASSPNR